MRRAAGGERRAGSVSPRGLSLRIGLAVGPNRLVAVEVRRRYPLAGTRYPGRVFTYDLPLAEALAELRAALGAAHLSVKIALLRPLGHTKAIAVPPVRRRELGALVLRNVRRYFAIGSDAALADARFLPRGRGAGSSGARGEPRNGATDEAVAQRPALAVAAPEREVETIAASVRAAGFEVDAITTASVALAEAVRALVPPARRGRVTVAVCSANWLETMQLAGGSPRLVRPFPGTRHGDAASIARQILGVAAESAAEGARSDAERRGRLLTVGCGEVDDALALAMASSEVPPPVPLAAPAIGGLDPTALAAFGAALVGEDAPLLLPADIRQTRHERATRTTRRLAVAAAASLAVAAGLHLWDVRRELRAVEAERRAIAPAVARATATRRAAASVLAQLDAVARLERAAPRYTEALAALADALPDSAYLVSLAANGASFRIGGVAKSTSAVVPALEASPLFAQVGLFSPVERDEESGSEQFDLTLALSRPALEVVGTGGAAGSAGTAGARNTSAGDVAPASPMSAGPTSATRASMPRPPREGTP